MPRWLDDRLRFPPAETASPEGVVAVGGTASPERLVLAYSQGIFPWPVDGLPLLWFSPDPRFVLSLDRVHLGRSLRRALARTTLRVAADERFDETLDRCASTPRPGQDGTWITDGLRAGFAALHRAGYAHSIEAYDGAHLVGGLYGISLGRAFFGESMFTVAPDASKIAFATLLGQLRTWGFAFVDCQVHTDHLERFGAIEVPRRSFLAELAAALEAPTRRGPWQLELAPREALATLATPPA